MQEMQADVSSIPRSGKSPGGGHGNPFLYSCLENSMDRGAWQATLHGITELDITEQLTHSCYVLLRAYQVVLLVKNLPASVGDIEIQDGYLSLENPLEEGMATHSSILAWRIPQIEEADRLQSMGSHKLIATLPSTQVFLYFVNMQA